jgi:hypothetical protein
MRTAPTSEMIAKAIATACRSTGEHPIEVLTNRWKMGHGRYSKAGGYQHHRARLYVFNAVRKVFPDLGWALIPPWLGVPDKLEGFYASCKVAKTTHWYDPRVEAGISCALLGGEPERLPVPSTEVPARLQRVSTRPVRKPVAAESSAPAQPPGSERPAPPKFKIGEHVSYEKFGVGQILEVRPSRSSFLVTVAFTSGRTLELGSASLRKFEGSPPVEEEESFFKTVEQGGQRRTQFPARALRIAPIVTNPTRGVVLNKMVRDAWTKIEMRRKPATDVIDMTSELCGDPALGRSALADAEPWVPYEQRTKGTTHF